MRWIRNWLGRRKTNGIVNIPFTPDQLKRIMAQMFDIETSEVRLTAYSVDEIAEYICIYICGE